MIDYVDVPTTAYGAPKTSTVDFVGIIAPNGKGIAFDAKTTANEVSFSLKNIKTHQIEYLRYFHEIGGNSYIFLQFYKLQGPEEFYKIPITFILEYWDNGKKSIKYKDMDKKWLTLTTDFI